MPPLYREFSVELINLLELKNECIAADPGFLYQINDAVFTDISWKRSCPLNPHKFIFDLITEKIPTPKMDTPKKIYITRKDSPRRKIVNEDEVIRAVEQEGYACLQLDGMPVAEQIAAFRNVTSFL
jgi:capsular polysaccharide biosynthesis protein